MPRRPGRPRGQGYIKFYRAWLEHPLWEQLTFGQRAIYLGLLCLADRGDRRSELAGCLCDRRGRPYSLREIARRLKCPPQTLHDAIQRFLLVAPVEPFPPLLEWCEVAGEMYLRIPRYIELVVEGQLWDRWEEIKASLRAAPVSDDRTAGVRYSDKSVRQSDTRPPSAVSDIRTNNGLAECPNTGQILSRGEMPESQSEQRETAHPAGQLGGAKNRGFIDSEPEAKNRGFRPPEPGTGRIYQENKYKNTPPKSPPENPNGPKSGEVVSPPAGRDRSGPDPNTILLRRDLQEIGFAEFEIEALLEHRSPRQLLAYTEEAKSLPCDQRRAWYEQKLGLRQILRIARRRQKEGRSP